MTSNNDIANSIAALAKHAILQEPITNTIIGTVKAINAVLNDDGTTSYYAVVTPSDLNMTDISNVQLSASDAALSDIPALGSNVCVTLFDSNSGYISQYGVVTQKILAQGTQNYGGLTIVGELTQKLNNAEQKINDLISFVTDLQTLFNAHIHLFPATGGAPTTVPTVTDTDTPPNNLTLTKVKDIENPVVVHGNGSSDQVAYQQQLQAAISAIQIQQAIVNEIANEISQYETNNPGQGIPASLQTQYQQAQTILQQKISAFNSLNTNPPQ